MSSREKNLVIVRYVDDQRHTPAQAAARFGVTRQWVHELVRRYTADGPAGVTPGSKAPKSHPGALPQQLRERIVALRRELVASGADAGPDTIAWHLQREGSRVPSTSTIRRVLHAAGLITPEPKKRPKSSYIRFEADLPNGCWQADITHWFLTDGTRIEILDFLDDHSRYLLHLHAATAFTGTMVVTVGCHSGLPVPDYLYPSGSVQARHFSTTQAINPTGESFKPYPKVCGRVAWMAL